MATSNFFKLNAREYYVMDNREYYDPATGEYLNEWKEGCEVSEGDPVDDLRQVGEAMGYDAIRQAVPYWDRGRTSFAVEKTFWTEIAGESVALNGRVFLRPGYYEAATLDWAIIAEGLDEMGANDPDGYAEDVADCVMDYCGWNKGLKAMNRAKVAGRVRKALEAVSDELNDFCRRICTGVYGVSEVFGNGEVWFSEMPRGAAAKGL